MLENGADLHLEVSDTSIVDPHGRQGIGVAQPQSGTDYPLLLPSSDIRYLLADFHIAFDQPSNYFDVPAFEPPFRIEWLSGFGVDDPQVTPPEFDAGHWSSICVSHEQSSSGSSYSARECLPLPKHLYDVIVVDKHGRVVFDSTHPLVTCETRPWGSRLQIVVWRHPTDQIVSLVYHTAWSPNDYPPRQDYSSYFFPVAAVLDERSIYRLPKRVRSLTVVLDNLRNTGVDFVAGYNMDLVTSGTSTIDGQRQVTSVTFNATPGAGLGIFPDCLPPVLNVTGINNVPPTVPGDFFISATDCYWVRQPTRIVDEQLLLSIPQINLTPGSIPTAGLPATDAGTTKSALGWPINDNPEYAQLQIGNDCAPCCDCTDYVTVADYMNQTRNKYQRVGKQLEGIRDLYTNNRDRWLAFSLCIASKPLRVNLLAQLCPFLDVALQLCNQTGSCKLSVQLSVTFTASPTGAEATEVPGFTFITGARTVPGRIAPATDRYQMGGAWPTFTAFFDTVQPGQSVNARFRLHFGNCGMAGDTPIAVTATLTATEGVNPLMTQPPTPIVATATATQTLNCPTNATPINLLECACSK